MADLRVKRASVSIRSILSLGFLILGIAFIGWSLYNIQNYTLRGTAMPPAPAATAEAVTGLQAAPAASHAGTAPQEAAPGVAPAGTGGGEPAVAQPASSAAPPGSAPSAAPPGAGGQEPAAQKTPAAAKEPPVKPLQAPLKSDRNRVLYPVRPKEGDNIGSLSIPAIGKKLPIVHGADEEELKAGVGHFARSVLPGEANNSVLSGHRDTVFRQLGKLKKGDELTVTTSAGVFTYQIKDMKIVRKDDKSVIVPSDHATLTVTTCYPFYYVGDAPDRYIIFSDLIKSE